MLLRTPTAALSFLLLVVSANAVQDEEEEVEMEDEAEGDILDKRQFRCDACRAFTLQLWKEFDSHKQSGLPPIDEDESKMIMRSLCKNKEVWQQYGLKDVDGEVKLYGPGLRANIQEGTVLPNTEYPKKLASVCRKYAKNLDHQELSAVFREEFHMIPALEEYLCYDSGLSILSACSWVRAQRWQDKGNDGFQMSDYRDEL